jgi:hypothetical protein
MKDFEIPEMLESMGGNSGFEFSPVQLIASIPQAIDGIVSSPVVMAGSATLLDGYATPGTLLTSILTEQTRAGIIFNISVKGFYPKASAAMILLFAEMVSQKFILIVSDISGEKVIFGNKNEPLSFNFSKSSKNAPGERSGYDFEFSGKVTQPIPVYSIVS